MVETPRGNRVHIAIFGRTNAGKSSLINCITNQNISLVSDVKGTTTDPVYKAMELLPIGPVVFIDTAGIDDISAIGALRIEKTTEVLDKMDISILVISAETILEDEILSFEQEWIKKIKDKKKVYFEIGPAPTLYSVGKDTFINEMIQTIGAENIFANQDAWISPSEESVIDANPDVILTNVNYVENPTKEIMSRDGWDNITAVKEKAVYSIDANSSSRPTQNIIKALKEMAKAVYPDEFKDK